MSRFSTADVLFHLLRYEHILFLEQTLLTQQWARNVNYKALPLFFPFPPLSYYPHFSSLFSSSYSLVSLYPLSLFPFHPFLWTYM